MSRGPAQEVTIRPVDAAELGPLLRGHPEITRQMQQPSFFVTAEWFDAVLSVTAPADVRVLGLYDNASLVGLLPLERRRNRLGGMDLRFLGYQYYPDPLGLICSAERLQPSITAVMRFLRDRQDWQRVVLNFLIPEEAALWDPAFRQQSVSPRLALHEDFDALLAGFGKKKRYKIRSAMRSAAKAGARFHAAEDGKARLDWLGQLFDLHAARSATIGRSSTLSDARLQQVHRALAEHSPSAKVFALRIGETPIAMLYGFLHHGRFAYYQVAHDPDYDRLGPGAVLLAHVIEWCCENGVPVFDFLQGNEDYKYRWADSVQPLAQATVVADRPLALGVNRLERMGVSIRSWLRRP